MERFTGLSGCQFIIKENEVIKYASGCPVRMRELKQSYVLQKNINEFGRIKVIPPNRLYEKNGTVYFSMKRIFEEKNESLIREHVIHYFSHLPRIEVTGFLDICKKRAHWFPDTDLKKILINELASCPDVYIFGKVHGDFGINNLISARENVYTYDMRVPFIQSPLHDVATFILSFGEEQNKFPQMILKTFAQYEKQIDIIKKMRVLEFYSEYNTEKTKEFHKSMFQQRKRK